jgi:hypothetical protein
MSVGRPSRELHPLCHEHHIGMKLNPILVTTGSEHTQLLVYACPEPDCCVRYSNSQGYFIPTQNGTGADADSLPQVRCEQDGIPMYLAEVLPERRSFRLWKCPQCNTSRASGALSVAT